MAVNNARPDRGRGLKYHAMNHVVSQLVLTEDCLKERPPSLGQLIALVDALHHRKLNPSQIEITRAFREGLNQFAGREAIFFALYRIYKKQRKKLNLVLI